MSAVFHPKHYNDHPSGIECWEIASHMSFCLGNAVKYLWCLDHKGKPQEDFRKAIFYVEKELERVTKGSGHAHFDFGRGSNNRTNAMRVVSSCKGNDPLAVLLINMVDGDSFYDGNLRRVAGNLRGHYKARFGETYTEE